MRATRLAFSFAAVLGLAAACHSGGGGGGSNTPTPTPTGTSDPNVFEHHHDAARRGVYVVPSLTKAAAAGLVLDAAFAPAVNGNVYAQPLYVASASGGHGQVIVVTEQNQVSAFDASNGSIAWQRTLAPPIPLSALPCGNIDPLGITGTPAIDPANGTLYLDAMTDAGGNTPKHEIYALSLADGSTKAGWPVDADSAIAADAVSFDSTVQNQRAALTVLGGKVYVAYGGHYGDCGTYYGWVAGIDESDPAQVSAWKSPLIATAIWGMSGIANDGTNLYVTTGNTTQPQMTWAGTESILRLQPGPVFSGNPVDYFAPSNFYDLDVNDIDLAGTGPVLVDLAGPPAAHLAIALGKDGKIYVANRDDLGGIGGELYQKQVASDEIINAAAAYTTTAGTFVVFKGTGIGCPNGSGDLTAVRLSPGSPPTAQVAWCASQNGGGSPMVTQTQVDGGDTIVWSLGTESENGAGDHRLHGFDGVTGAVVYDGAGAAEQMGSLRRYITPIVAGGRIVVAGDGQVYAFRAP